MTVERSGAVNLDGVPRWRGALDDKPMPVGPWIADVHSFDLPPTIAGCIRNAGPGCVAVVLVDRGGSEMREAAERAARERGIAIIWEDRCAAVGMLADPDTCGLAGRVGGRWP